MSSSIGSIKSTSAYGFSATFTIEDTVFTFSGSLQTSVPAFICNSATLEYNDVQQVTFTRSFEGRVGPTTVSISMTNGPTITGTLDAPISGPGAAFCGTGVWIEK